MPTLPRGAVPAMRYPTPGPSPVINVGDVQIKPAGWHPSQSATVLREDTMAVVVSAWPDMVQKCWWVGFVTWRPTSSDHPRYGGTAKVFAQVLNAMPFLPRGSERMYRVMSQSAGGGSTKAQRDREREEESRERLDTMREESARYAVYHNIVFVHEDWPHVIRAMIAALAAHGYSLWYMNYQYRHLDALVAPRRMDIFGPTIQMPEVRKTPWERWKASQVPVEKVGLSRVIFNRALYWLGIPEGIGEEQLRQFNVGAHATRLIEAIDPDAVHFESKKKIRQAVGKIEKLRQKEIDEARREAEEVLVRVLRAEGGAITAEQRAAEQRSQELERRETITEITLRPLPEMGPLLHEEAADPVLMFDPETGQERLAPEERPELPPEWERDAAPSNIPVAKVTLLRKRWSAKLGRYVETIPVESTFDVQQWKSVTKRIREIRRAADIVQMWQRGDLEVV